MRKTYLLGLPLFNFIFWITSRIEYLVYRAEAQNNPNMAPVTLLLIIYMLLLYGGFVFIAMAYGGYLFSKWRGTPKHIICYSLLTFAVASVFLLQDLTGSWRKSMYWILPSCEQMLGFLIGALIAFKRQR